MKQLLTILALSCGIFLQAAYQERITVFTDKDFYLSGEDLLVTVTTTDQHHRPMEFSKIAYVELTDSTHSHVQIMIMLSESSGNGILSVPEQLPSGNYRLRAYTRYMRNESPEVFAGKLITVVNAGTLHQSQLGSSDTIPTPESHTGTMRMLHSDKQQYGRRQPGKLTIRNLPQDVQLYHLSIAAHIPTNASTLESPPEKLRPASQSSNYLAEYEGHILRANIKGNIQDGKTVVLSVPGNRLQLFTGRKTADGEYEFITTGISGITEIASTINTREEERYTLEFNSPYAPLSKTDIPALRIDSSCLPDLLQRYVSLQAKEAFEPTMYSYLPTPTVGRYIPGWTYKLEEYTRFNTLEEVILEFVSNVRFRKVNGIRTLSINRDGPDGYTLGNTLVLLDNVPVFDHELLLRYDASLIDRLEVFRGQYIFGGQLFDGIVSFSSIAGDFRGFQLDRSTFISTYKGPQPGYRLVEPSFNSNAKTTNQPDTRTTLLWESRSSAANAELPFYTSDLSGTYRICIQGLTQSGKLFSETAFFKVN